MVPEFMDGLWNAILFRCLKMPREKMVGKKGI